MKVNRKNLNIRYKAGKETLNIRVEGRMRKGGVKENDYSAILQILN